MKSFIVLVFLGLSASTIVKSASRAQFKEIGCFLDKGNVPRPLPTSLANLRSNIDWNDMRKTVNNCSVLAREKGFQMFGVQFFGECWGGVGKSYARDGRSDNCWSGVGREGANFVYELEQQANWVKVPYKFIEGDVITETSSQSDDHVLSTCKGQCVKHAGCQAIRLYELVGTTYCTLFSTITGYKCPADNYDLECIIANGESWKRV